MRSAYLLCWGLLLLTACARDVTVRYAAPQVAAYGLQGRLDGKPFSTGTLLELEAMFAGEPGHPTLQGQLDFLAEQRETAERLVAEAEVHLALAATTEPGGAWLPTARANRLASYLLHTTEAAEAADRALSRFAQRPGAWRTDRAAFARRIYNYAVAQFLRTHNPDTLQTRFDQPGLQWDPAHFDAFVPTPDVLVRGITPVHRRMEFGVPVSAIREQQQVGRSEAHIPPEGAIYPATATLDFEDGAPILRLWNPDYVDTIERYGQRVPISIDTTTPIGELFARTDLAHEGRQGLIEVERYLRRTGIYLHEPYHPDKIPLLMVHGLRSSPITWRQMLNHLRANPEIRRRYQIWMFMYPTGVPVPRSAFYLRRDLAALRRELDPDGNDANLKRMVVLGHSMGGLVSKAQVQNSGTRLWESLHPEPFDEIDASAEVRAHLREVFFYQADPDIARMIFIASPHRGSPMANSDIGRLGDSLVQLPEEFLPVKAWVAAERKRLPHDERYQLSRGVPSSIDDLLEDAPHMQAYLEMPIRSDLPLHNIIGNADGDSDGVVPVSSARLEGVQSERVVPAHHDAHMHPQALAEVERILLLHLRS